MKTQFIGLKWSLVTQKLTTLTKGSGEWAFVLEIPTSFFCDPFQYIFSMIVWVGQNTCPHAYDCKSSCEAPAGFKFDIHIIKYYTTHILWHDQADPILTLSDPSGKSNNWKRHFFSIEF